MSSTQPALSPCNVCGAQDFEWGGIPSHFTNDPYAFINVRGRKMVGRLCLKCGAIQFFLEDAVAGTLAGLRNLNEKPKRE